MKILAIAFLSVSALVLWVSFQSRPTPEVTVVATSFPGPETSEILTIRRADQTWAKVYSRGLLRLAPPEQTPVLMFEPEWEAELYDYLISVDAHHGEEIYREYERESRQFAADMKRNLSWNIVTLSSLNGESLHWEQQSKMEEEDFPKDEVTILTLSHNQKLAQIFGDHLPAIEEQYELYKQLNEKTTDL